MSRSTPPTPNLSAMEDRRLDKIEQIRAEMRAEAGDRERRLRMAASTGTVVQRPHKALSVFEQEAERVMRLKARGDDVESRYVDNRVCGNCGTRAVVHDQFGCKRWRG